MTSVAHALRAHAAAHTYTSEDALASQRFASYAAADLIFWAEERAAAVGAVVQAIRGKGSLSANLPPRRLDVAGYNKGVILWRLKLPGAVATLLDHDDGPKASAFDAAVPPRAPVYFPALESLGAEEALLDSALAAMAGSTSPDIRAECEALLEALGTELRAVHAYRSAIRAGEDALRR